MNRSLASDDLVTTITSKCRHALPDQLVKRLRSRRGFEHSLVREDEHYSSFPPPGKPFGKFLFRRPEIGPACRAVTPRAPEGHRVGEARIIGSLKTPSREKTKNPAKRAKPIQS